MIAKFTRKDFLEAIFGQYYKEHRGFILVKSFKRGDPKMSTRYFPNIEILAKEHYGEERDVYFGICPRERMKAEREHIHYVVALWADLDIGREGHEDKHIFFEGPQQAAKAIRGFPRAPSIIVESGRGAHLYWLLNQVSEVTDLERVERVLKNINNHLQCDTDLNLDSVLRLPETLNTKVPGKPVACEVKFINPNFRYSLQDFENLGQRITVAAPKPAAPAPPPPKPVIAASPVMEQFIEEPDEEPTPDGAVVPDEQAVDDSLVLDETIIDELIDDISMAASVVADLPSPKSEPVSFPPRPAADMSDHGPEPPSTTAFARSSTSIVASTSSVLERLSSSRASVEVLLLGSSTTITGVLLWNENGLIGVESSGSLYTIPLSSVSFIKSSAL